MRDLPEPLSLGDAISNEKSRNDVPAVLSKERDESRIENGLPTLLEAGEWSGIRPRVDTPSSSSGSHAGLLLFCLVIIAPQNLIAPLPISTALALRLRACTFADRLAPARSTGG